ncbi:MAG TPA: S8 family serine peptidase [Burkholderiales bacterium]|nr:S8 family serine peptidase [Burkholderiales bacterium]
MKKEHVILRRAPHTGAPRAHPPTPTLEVKGLDRKEKRELQNDPSVLALAPAASGAPTVPSPASTQAASEGPPQGMQWGVKAVGADTSPFTGKGVTVAILDSGIDIDHPAFHDIKDRIVQQDFTGKGNGDTGTGRIAGHGTHCAGVLFGQDVDGRRIGVARDIEKVLIGKIIADDVELAPARMAKAIAWAAAQGAHVISLSLDIRLLDGMMTDLAANMPPAIALSKALIGYRDTLRFFEQLARQIEPCVLIAAAGNDSLREADEDWEAAVNLPAAARNVLAVSALSFRDNVLASWHSSNTDANVSGPGADIWSATPMPERWRRRNGTSTATPHVAGVAALWAEKLRKEDRLDAETLRNAVIDSCTTRGIPEEYDAHDYGAGMVQAPQS